MNKIIKFIYINSWGSGPKNNTKCTAKCDAFVVFSVVMLEATLVGGSSGDKNLPAMYADTTRSLEFERDHFLIIHVAIF
ncbi:MAG: hypothetical protein WA364_22390 [Candidatus Nitrosopolaris sp.]